MKIYKSELWSEIHYLESYHMPKSFMEFGKLQDTEYQKDQSRLIWVVNRQFGIQFRDVKHRNLQEFQRMQKYFPCTVTRVLKTPFCTSFNFSGEVKLWVFMAVLKQNPIESIICKEIFVKLKRPIRKVLCDDMF